MVSLAKPGPSHERTRAAGLGAPKNARRISFNPLVRTAWPDSSRGPWAPSFSTTVDPPTASLDPRSRRQLIALLATFVHTKIIATHDLDLALERAGEALTPSERVAAPVVGLVAIDVGANPVAEIAEKVVLRGLPLRRAVKFSIYTIAFDGKEFTVARTDGELKRGDAEAVIGGTI